MALVSDMESKWEQERNGVRMASFGLTAPKRGPGMEQVEQVTKVVRPIKPCCYYGNQRIIYIKHGQEKEVNAYMEFSVDRVLINFCPWCAADMRELNT